jgi:hypothetical protein|nr:MAG TPA: Sporulation protein Cse60 [Caudoviricetes sp.]
MNKDTAYKIFRSNYNDQIQLQVKEFIKDKEVKDITWSYNEMTNEYVAIVYYLISNA